MKRIFLIIISMFFTSSFLFALNVDSLKTAADRAYAKENFALSAQLYEQIAREGESAAICYNLGNAYYRQDDIAHAILWYERAHLLNPGDDDIRFNLDMARSKTIDRIVPVHEFFFVSWWHQLVNLMSADQWAWLSLAFFLLCLVALAVYIYTSPIWLRKLAFTLSVIFLLLTILGNVSAFGQRSRLTHRTGAIVMSSSAVVKSTPSATGSDLFVLHEGTFVTIKDPTLSDWTEVTLADGKQGWIQSKLIEPV